MTDLKQAAQQALEALEDYKYAEARDALRAALAEPEQEPVKWHHPECEGECIACLIERAVQEAYGSQGLAYLQRHLVSQPRPEPMGWITAGQHTAPLRTHWEGCEAVHPECKKENT